MNLSRENTGEESATSGLVDSVDQMVRWPFQVTGATWDFMMQGVRSMSGSGQRSSGNTGTGSMDFSGSSGSGSGDSMSSSNSSGSTSPGSLLNDQDLSGDDLKYVVWSIVFTKPGYEAVVESQQCEIVNYSADVSSFAAIKMANFLEGARHGHLDRPESWGSRAYPPDLAATTERRTDVITSTADETTVSSRTSGGTTTASARDRDKGWRIPVEDHKYLTFLLRVEWRLPKQEPEVARVERVTIERGTAPRMA